MTRKTSRVSTDRVRSLQEALIELGYDPAVPDGIWDNKTRVAAQTFQKDAGLAISGKLDDETADRLGL